MDSSSKDKRRYPRRHAALAIELRTQGSAFPIINQTSDLSPGGCYVNLLSTFPAGTKLDIVLWAGETRLSFPGTIITADANVGNGIDFSGMSDEQRTQLQNYLDEIQAPDASSDIIFH